MTVITEPSNTEGAVDTVITELSNAEGTVYIVTTEQRARLT